MFAWPKKVVVVGIILGEAYKAIGGGVNQPQASSGTDRCVGATFAPTVIVNVFAHQPSPQSSPLLRVPLFIKGEDLGGGIFKKTQQPVGATAQVAMYCRGQASWEGIG